jgi:hypothetical protein
VSYHLLGYQILQDSKIQFRLQVKTYISDWRLSKLRLLASYVSRHMAMAYDTLLRNKSITHLRLLPIFPFALTVLHHFSICTHVSLPFFGAARRRQNKTEQDYWVPELHYHNITPALQ